MQAQIIKQIYHRIWLLLCLLCLPLWTLGQPNSSESAAKVKVKQLIQKGQFDQAIPLLQKLYEEAPFDRSRYKDYLNALVETKNYSQADSLVHFMMKIRRSDPALFVDLGKVAEAQGQKKEAEKHYEEAIQNVTKNLMMAKPLADAFSSIGKDDDAIRVYLKAREVSGNPFSFATELSLLYSKKGDSKGAINALLDKAMTQVGIKDELQAALLQVIAKEKNGLKEIQKSLNSRLKQNPENPVWQQLLSWTYTQDGNFAGALKNLKALDETFKEQGKRVLPFAKNALDAGKYEIALAAYDYILQKGKDQPYYQMAAAGKLNCGLIKLENEFPPQKEAISNLIGEFHNFFEHFPQYKTSNFMRQYAMVEARYNNHPDSAIRILKQVAGSHEKMSDFQGWCRLDMGDYYLLTGKIWEATLHYSQVNKAFQQDELGELARFKNAKWAFYKGDFNLAQEQLSVLKASTSKLIANDALYLSVLITENIPEDSNMVPLQRFAAADLLLFKHRNSEADQLLDSISKAWPGTPLQDDIAMLRGKTAADAGNWKEAIQYYKTVLEEYGEDVLGDDAAWRLAELYRTQLKDNEQAKKYYTTVILQYPGSTFIQEARKWYRKLSGNDKEMQGTRSSL